MPTGAVANARQQINTGHVCLSATQGGLPDYAYKKDEIEISVETRQIEKRIEK